MLDEFLKANLGLWNEWTEIHETSEFYDLEGFGRARSSLHSIERDELGDVAGKRLLHLQCHFGLDTLSWARLGATVTGVDFSERRHRSGPLAVGRARAAGHIRAVDRRRAAKQPDAAPSTSSSPPTAPSSGSPTCRRWAQTIAHFLAPGGTFYMVELHPLARTLDDLDAHPELRVVGPYFPAGRPRRLRIHGSYAAPDAHVKNDLAYGWTHSFAEILNALIGAGLRLEYLHEFPCSVVPFSRSMERAPDGWYYLPDGRRDVPFLFSLRATKADAAEHGTQS